MRGGRPTGPLPRIRWITFVDLAKVGGLLYEIFTETIVSHSGIFSHRSKVKQKRIFRENKAVMTHFGHVTTSLKRPLRLLFPETLYKMCNRNPVLLEWGPSTPPASAH